MSQEERDRSDLLARHPEIVERVIQQIEAESTRIEGLIYGKGGVPKPCLANAVAYLRQHRDWKGVLAYNEFSLRVVGKRSAPWQSEAGTIWTDHDDSQTAVWFQKQEVMIKSSVAAEAVQMVAKENSFHPVRDYLESLDWDGKPRIGEWLIAYMGAEDTQVVRAIGERWLIAACARIFEPGCQCDYTLLLQGPQGIGKSSALRALASDEWFTDHLSDLSNKDSRIELQGRWIVELSELDRVRRSEVEQVKGFLTARWDNFRLPYGRRTESISRSCVFAATTNDGSPFTDETGNRRFWPIHCSKIDVVGLGRDRDQLWAEAYSRYRSGGVWWLDSDELNRAARDRQEEMYDVDPWDDVILEWCANPHKRPDTAELCISEAYKVTVTDILVHAVGKNLKDITKLDKRRVVGCLIHDGWKQKQERRGLHRGKRFYVKTEVD